MQRPVAFVIEDQASLNVLYEDALRLVGYDVIAVRDGLQALNQLEINEPPTLIILDINLPSLSGRDIHRHIRKHSRYDKTPVMILTANSVMATAIQPDITSKDYLFIKPISMKELQNFAKQMRAAKSDTQEPKQQTESLSILEAEDVAEDTAKFVVESIMSEVQETESLSILETEDVAEDTAKFVVESIMSEVQETESLPILETEDDEETAKNPNIHATTPADTQSSEAQDENKSSDTPEAKSTEKTEDKNDAESK
jgi:DNA-binding response OmpR family regulator